MMSVDQSLEVVDSGAMGMISPLDSGAMGLISPFMEPSEAMCEEITKQTELVFSDASLSKDTFLLKHVKRNKVKMIRKSPTMNTGVKTYIYICFPLFINI